MNIGKDLVGASTAVLILGVVARKPSYGYQIVKQINDLAAEAICWQEGTVYPVLHKLETDGLVKSEWRTAESGRRRKYYIITGAGREAIAEGSRLWDFFHSLVRTMTEVRYA